MRTVRPRYAPPMLPDLSPGAERPDLASAGELATQSTKGGTTPRQLITYNNILADRFRQPASVGIGARGKVGGF